MCTGSRTTPVSRVGFVGDQRRHAETLPLAPAAAAATAAATAQQRQLSPIMFVARYVLAMVRFRFGCFMRVRTYITHLATRAFLATAPPWTPAAGGMLPQTVQQLGIVFVFFVCGEREGGVSNSVPGAEKSSSIAS